MARWPEAPYRQQRLSEVATMLEGLENNKGKGKGKGGYSCKKNTYSVDGTDITVDSWKFQEWDFKKDKLPTYARGLFTALNNNGQPEIVARGYDKFFNHGEVRETDWRNVERNTRGPYELSVKENGCIIFISGLPDGTLLVCSKHSTGTRSDVEASHAKVGEEWVDRHLARIGKNRHQLAYQLREMNATAVAELCDDEFEEHVLAYTPDTAGLYLHGINLNLPDFATYPHHLVDRFADEWGFKKTQYIVKNDLNDVKQFLDKIAETGNYEGRDTEGFVIRCHSKAGSGEWHDWFFKYKFEEPYLMYRQWRECTKAIISGKEPRYKQHKKITEEYIDFARRQLHGNPELAKAYQANHGIIKMRDDFLAFRGLKGSDIIRQEAIEGETADGDATQDIVLVPVATIGCGKTTVALALCKLFGWGHVQNDNITVRGKKPQAFATACAKELETQAAMVADRNNHQRRERKQLIEDVSKVVPRARFVCMHYAHDRDDYENIRHALRERVLQRGDNHQTIHPSTKGEQEIIGIMEGFMHRFEPVNPQTQPDDGFDTVINLDPCLTSRENLETVITKLYEQYPKLFTQSQMPSDADMDQAIDAALHGYTVDLKHEISGPKPKGPKQNNNSNPNPPNQLKQKPRNLEYIAVQIPANRILAILEALFRDSPDPQTAHMYHNLKFSNRLQQSFHVTLIHRASATATPENRDYWNALTHLHEKVSAPNAERNYFSPDAKLGLCDVRLERLVWDDRVMAFVVRLAPKEVAADGGDGGVVFRSVNEMAHVTVGTARAEVKPKESNDLLARWLKEGSGGVSGIGELAVKGNVELEGVVRGVLGR